MRWPPAATCAGCEKSVSDIGGLRIVARRFMGIGLFHDNETVALRSLHQPGRTFRLEGRYRQVVVVFWGDAWMPDRIERGLEAAQAGSWPWLCQRCMRHALCEHCGCPYRWPPGADVIGDDGRRLHCAILPVTPPCTNPDCPNRRAPPESRAG